VIKEKASQVRRIAVVTGTRAEYGLLQSTLREIAGHKRLELLLVVTGMHLLKKFGYTIDDIVRDGWRIDARIPMQRGDDAPLDQAGGLSRGVAGIAEFLVKSSTDIVVVLGDRIEVMAAALAAVTTHRILAHIHGGDLAQGDLDDSLRHAITKLAHVHLAATKSSARRIIRMGESRERVHVVGAPGLDDLGDLVAEYSSTFPKRAGRESAATKTHVKGETGNSEGRIAQTKCCGSALILQHPRGRSAEREYQTMRAILDVVAKAGLSRTVIYPNSDAGHVGIIRAIDEHAQLGGGAGLEVVRSLDRASYLRRLIKADVLIGNSSSGIIEAATAGTPAVNVGSRQAGRERSGRSVIDVDETRRSIGMALSRALRMRPRMGVRTVYGDGRAGQRIAGILSKVPLDEGFRRKRNAY
jgi:GDP/UDP-N,N'-diacetylbacillosamine 2-epimerase (hydrolysing)